MSERAATCHPERLEVARGLCRKCYPVNRSPATCHPGRPSKGRGLCGSCYLREYWAHRGEKPPKAKRRPSDCHPGRPSHGRGLCHSCYKREYGGSKHAEGQLRSRLKVYGLTPDEYRAMVEAQEGRCAICRRDPKGRLHVDHDHDTGEVRGLLCNQCNRMVGLAHDDASVLASGAEYLLRYYRRLVV